VIHFIGLEMHVKTRVRQRCSWCGEILEDVDLSLMMVPAGSDGLWKGWEVGALLAVEGNGRWIVKPEVEGRLPLGTCAEKDLPKTLRLVK
jgi:hypothetical protein